MIFVSYDCHVVDDLPVDFPFDFYPSKSSTELPVEFQSTNVKRLIMDKDHIFVLVVSLSMMDGTLSVDLIY